MGFQFALAAIIPTIMCLHSCFDWLAFARYPKWTPRSLSRFCFFLSHFFPLRLCLLSIRFVGNVGIVHVLRARKSIWNGRLWLKANWRLFSAIYYGEPNMIVLAALCVWVSSRCSTLRVQHILNRWWNHQRSLSHTVVALARHDRSIISMCLKCVSIGSFLFISSPIYIGTDTGKCNSCSVFYCTCSVWRKDFACISIEPHFIMQFNCKLQQKPVAKPDDFSTQLLLIIKTSSAILLSIENRSINKKTPFRFEWVWRCYWCFCCYRWCCCCRCCCCFYRCWCYRLTSFVLSTSKV